MNKRQTSRPQNMSQLDYLWVNYGSYEVSDSLDTPNSIPTSEAVKQLVTESDTGIVELGAYESDVTHKIKIFGKDKYGAEITSFSIDLDTKVTLFERHKITQEDLANGIGLELGEEWLHLKTTNDLEFWVSLEDLIAKGLETDSIVVDTQDGKIAATLKINNPIVDKSVKLTSTNDGLKADLIINEDTNSKVLLVKGDNGVETKFVWEGTNTPIGFRFLTFDEYKLSAIDPGIIYFITDDPAIYFNNQRFSSLGLNPTDYTTKLEMLEAIKEERERAIGVENQLKEEFDGFKIGLANKVDWLLVDDTHRTIRLNNTDSISGTDVKGNTYDLVLISKDNKAEVGSLGLSLLLKGFDERPTYNDKEIALLDDLKESIEVTIPIRTLLDKVYDQATILGWFGVKTIAELKNLVIKEGLFYLRYLISLSGNPYSYKMPIEYIAFETANLIKLVVLGLNTLNDVPSKYEIIINLDGTIIEGNSNIKISIIPVVIYELVDADGRKAIVLENNDMILGKATDGSTNNLIMVNKWDVVDVGTSALPINLNTTADKRPTVLAEGQSGDQAEDIAYLSDFNWTLVE